MDRKTALAAGFALLGLALATGFARPAEARTSFSVGIGVPLVPGPYYYPHYYYPPPYYPPPYYPPYYYAPPPAVYVPPAAPAYIAQPTQTWYYCDNPKGYYPYVTACSSAWRPVPATPPAK